MATGILLCLFSFFIGFAKTGQTGSSVLYKVKNYGCKALYEFNVPVTQAVFYNSTYGIRKTYSGTLLPAVVIIPANSNVRLSIDITGTKITYDSSAIQSSPEVCYNDTVRRLKNCYTLNLLSPQKCAVSSWPNYPDFYKESDCDSCSCQYCYIGHQSVRHQFIVPLKHGYGHLFDAKLSPVNKTSKNIKRQRANLLKLGIVLKPKAVRLSLPRGGLLERYFLVDTLKGGFKLHPKPKVVLPQNGQIRIYFYEETGNPSIINVIEYNIQWYTKLNCSISRLSATHLNEPIGRIDCELVLQEKIIYEVFNDKFQMIGNRLYLKELTTKGNNINITVSAMYKGRNDSQFAANIKVKITDIVPANSSMITFYGCTANMNYSLLNYTTMYFNAFSNGKYTEYGQIHYGTQSDYTIDFVQNSSILITLDDGPRRFNIRATSPKICCKGSVVGNGICFELNLTCPQSCQVTSWPEYKDFEKKNNCGKCLCRYCYRGSVIGLKELLVPLKYTTHRFLVDITPDLTELIYRREKFFSPIKFSLNPIFTFSTSENTSFHQYFRMDVINNSYILRLKDKDHFPLNGSVERSFSTKTAASSPTKFKIIWYSPLKCSPHFLKVKFLNDPLLEIHCGNNPPLPIVFNHSSAEFQLMKNRLYLKELTTKGDNINTTVSAMYEGRSDSQFAVDIDVKIPDIVPANSSMLTFYGCTAVINYSLLNYTTIYRTKDGSVINSDIFPPNSTIIIILHVTRQLSRFTFNIKATTPEICCKGSVVGNGICFELNLTCPQSCQVTSWPEYKDFEKKNCGKCLCRYCYHGSIIGLKELLVPLKNTTQRFLVDVIPELTELIQPRERFLSNITFRLDSNSSFLISKNTSFHQYFQMKFENNSYNLGLKDKGTFPLNGRVLLYIPTKLAATPRREFPIVWYSPLKCIPHLLQVKYLNDPLLEMHCEEASILPIVFTPSSGIFQMKNNLLYLKDLTASVPKLLSIKAMISSQPDSIISIDLRTPRVPENSSLFTVYGCAAVFNFTFLNYTSLKIDNHQLGFTDSPCLVHVPENSSLFTVYGCAAVFNFTFLNYTSLKIDNHQLGFTDHLTDRPFYYAITLASNKTTTFELNLNDQMYTITMTSSETCCNHTVSNLIICHTINMTCPETCQVSSWPEYPDFYQTLDCNKCSCKYCYVGNISIFYKLEIPLKSSSHLVGINVSRVDKTTIEVLRPRREFRTLFQLPSSTLLDQLPPSRHDTLQRYFLIEQIKGSFHLRPKDKMVLPQNGHIQLYFASSRSKAIRIITYSITWYSPINCNITKLPARYRNDPRLRIDCENILEKTIVFILSEPYFQMKDNYLYLKDLSISGSLNVNITAMYEGLNESATHIFSYTDEDVPPLLTVKGCQAVFDFPSLNYRRLNLYSPQLRLSISLSDRRLYYIDLQPNETTTFDFQIDEGTRNTLKAVSPEFCCNQSIPIVSIKICFQLNFTCRGACAVSAWRNDKDFYKTSKCTGCQCQYCYIGEKGGSTNFSVSGKSSTYTWTVPLPVVSMKSTQQIISRKSLLSPFQLHYFAVLPLRWGSFVQRYFNLTSNNSIATIHLKKTKTLPPNGHFELYFYSHSTHRYNLTWVSPLRCNVSYLHRKKLSDPVLSVDCANPIQYTIIYRQPNIYFQMKNNSVYVKDLTTRGSFNFSITAMYKSLPDSAYTVNVYLEVGQMFISRLTAVKDSKYRYHFTCYTNSTLKDITYEWSWNGSPVFTGLSSSIQNGKSQGTIVFDGFNENDSGNLACHVKRKYFIPATKIKSITMKYFPVVELNTTSHIIKNGKPVKVACHLYPTYGTTELVLKINNTEVKETTLDLSEKASISCYGKNEVGRGEIKKLRISSANGKDFCPAEIKENRKWPETIENTRVNVPCNKEFPGTLSSRFCSINATWEEPDNSNCVKLLILEAKSTLKRIESIGGNLQSALELLVEATKESMKAKDINETIICLKIVSRIIYNREEVSKKEVEGFVEVVNNLVANNTKSAWAKLKDEKQLTPAYILKITEDFGEIAATRIKGTVYIKTENTVLKLQKVDKYKNITFLDPNDPKPEWASKGQVFIHTNILRRKFEANESIVMNAGIFRNIYDLLPNSENTSSTVNSVIMAISLGKGLVNLKEKITLSFSHLSKITGKSSCNFLDFDKNPELGGYWSTRGCEVNTTNSTYTVCGCDHLTNFAILMKPVAVESTELNRKILGIITKVGCSISIASLVLTIIIYKYCWGKVTSQEVTRSQSILLMNLCVSLIIAYLLFLILVKETGEKNACKAIAALIHYFLLVSFFTMLAEGIDMSIALTVVFISKVSRLPWLLIISWVGPAIIVGISLGATLTNGYGNDDYCWLTHERNVHWAFIAPVLVIILANMICVVLIVKALLSAYCMVRESVKERLRTGARAIGIMTPLMGFTWMFGLFSVNQDSVVFEYIFTVVNSLQGFFIFLTHCVFNNQIRKSIRKSKRTTSRTGTHTGTRTRSHTRGYSGTRTTEFSYSQKKSYSNDESFKRSSDIMSDNAYENSHVEPERRLSYASHRRSSMPY